MHFSKGFIPLLLFLACGGLIGSILGQLMAGADFVGLMPYFTQNFDVFDLKDVFLNLGILQFHFGIRFAPNLISIIGILIAWWLYKKF